MEYKDYYKTLGVEKKATPAEIKAAYRKLARKHHPDVNPGDKKSETRFKEINEANEVLSDPDKRSKYDRFGADFKRWEQGGGRPDDFWSQFAGAQGGGPRGGGARQMRPEDLKDLFGEQGSFSDFFSALFGGLRQPAGPARGQDVEGTVEITLAEAYHGAMRTVSRDGASRDVRIPRGAQTGTRVRVRGEGTSGRAGGGSGDLYLTISVAPDERFERRGDDLYVSVPVDLYVAVLGGEVRVPTLEGEVTLKVPEGSQPGRSLRVRGKGMPRLGKPTEHGDLYARLELQLPAKLSARERELFTELRTLSTEH